MPPIQFWQVAAGLGVGAFLAAIFYGVVRQFGRKPGEGFQTSKLGRQATAIIAVLIVILFGAITIIGLVIYAPHPGDAKPQIPIISPDAQAAAKGWEQGTTIIINGIRTFLTGYRSKLAKRLNVELSNLKSEIAKRPDHAKSEHLLVVDEYDQSAHQLYSDKEVDPRVINPKVRAHFGILLVTLPDGKRETINSATQKGRTIKEDVFAAAFDAAKAGLDPLSDRALLSILEDYLQHRQRITEAIESYLSAPTKNSK